MKKEFENPLALSENRLPARTIMLPAQREDVFYLNKTDSDRIRLLNGTWKFFYAAEEASLPPEYFLPETDDAGWDSVPVPSEWQFLGYGKPRYVNVDYPFPFDPPFIAADNPVGVYRLHFTPDKGTVNRDVILHFDGVDGAFLLYVNGRYIGFSKGSRVPAEFDITDAVNPHGENVLCVAVYTYSDANYLENQDMWMANGIFRDVYLIYQNKVCLWDYEITTTQNSVAVALYPNKENTDLRAELTFDRRTRKTNLHTTASVRYDLPAPELWNAEDPYLYTLLIRIYQGDTLTEIHTKKIGLRESSITDGLFCINGKPIQFLGTNRHEYRPGKGRAVSAEDIREDLTLLKSCNFNSIRTSHYPQHPAFYELCNEMGFYIVDEADIETHGAGVTGDQGWLSKHADWKNAYLDRVERMYKRDRNETCVVVWSIGNECGTGENIVACAGWLRAQKNAKPILQAQDNDAHPAFSDFRQFGYPDLATVKRFADMESDYPAVSTEYGHAMGNSPGGLADIWDIIDENPQMQGGWIWEFRSHGFEKKLPDGGKTYLYGGDFDEGANWANFVIDGYVFSDGTPKPSLSEIKYLIAPLRIHEKDGGLQIYCRNTFTRLDNCSMLWNITEDTAIIQSGMQTGLGFAPGELSRIPYPAEAPKERKPGAVYRLNLMIFCGEKDITYFQTELTAEPKKPYSAPSCRFRITETDDTVTIADADASVSFHGGLLTSLVKNGKVLLSTPMQMSFYRANTDNDGIIRGIRKRHFRDVWDDAHLDTMRYKEESHSVSETGADCTLISRGKIVTEGRYLGFFTEIRYRICAGGVVTVSVKGDPFGYLPEILPRIGVSFTTEKAFDNVTWYGRGWDENYPDRKTSTIIGKYSGRVADMSVLYDRPQENGNRCDTRYVTLTDTADTGLAFCATDTFSFSVHEYSMKALVASEHRHELQKDEKHNYLYLDYAVRGLGSASCGPEPEERYELHPHAFTFAFTVAPFRNEEETLTLCRADMGTHSEKRSDSYRFSGDLNTDRENFDCRI